MTVRIASFGAAAALLSLAVFSTPASAQRYYHRDYDDYSRTVTRCDRDGDRCATYRCDRDGDDCRRISRFYRRYAYGDDRYYRRGYYDRGYTVRRCDYDGDDCAYYRCDSDGDSCRRL